MLDFTYFCFCAIVYSNKVVIIISFLKITSPKFSVWCLISRLNVSFLTVVFFHFFFFFCASIFHYPSLSFRNWLTAVVWLGKGKALFGRSPSALQYEATRRAVLARIESAFLIDPARDLTHSRPCRHSRLPANCDNNCFVECIYRIFLRNIRESKDNEQHSPQHFPLRRLVSAVISVKHEEGKWRGNSLQSLSSSRKKFMRPQNWRANARNTILRRTRADRCVVVTKATVVSSNFACKVK